MRGSTRPLEGRHADPRRATAEDVTWRKIMERTAAFLDEMEAWIHPDYLDGWRRLALPVDRVPALDEVIARLAPTGWRLVPVDDYVPTDQYVELLANRVFPVARHLRRPEHVDHSPMPDMAHDLIGHLPMLFSAAHGGYLRALGRAMAGAEPNVLDHELYEANKALGKLRSAGLVTDELEAAEDRAADALARLSASPSPLTRLGRLYLWTVEFGLLGTREAPRVYGSALLSSPRECRSLLARREAILDLVAGAIDHDITFCDPQSRYYVAPDHARLHAVLAEVTAGAPR